MESAIQQPKAIFSGQHLHTFPFEMAAAYLFHIVKNHPFVDGNKRTGVVSALVFLKWNGFFFNCEPGKLAELTLGVAKGIISKEKITYFLRTHANQE